MGEALSSFDLALDACALMLSLVLATMRFFAPGGPAHAMSALCLSVAAFCGMDMACLVTQGPGQVPVVLAAGRLVALVAFVGCLAWYARLCGQRYGATPLLVAFPVVAVFVQVLVMGVHVLGIVLACGLLVTMMGVQMRHERRLVRRRAELDEARVEAVLSQVQPHFLFNTLTALRCLCRTEPARAAGALADFSSYLRASVGSLGRGDLVDIDEELVCVETYLRLEALRLGERLGVEYDVRAHGFCLPALTVQALVENAVRNEVSKCEGGGVVTVSTGRDPRGFVVVVAVRLSGVPRPREEDVARSRRRIERAGERLGLTGAGSLSVEGCLGRGSCARIVLPQEGRAHRLRRMGTA